MDYKELLKKYMQHVGDCEGTSFLHLLNSGCGCEVDFTNEEVEALEKIHEELYE